MDLSENDTVVHIFPMKIVIKGEILYLISGQNYIY
jgi:hypothetical protein